MAGLKVVQKDGEEVAPEIIAGAVVAISDGIKKLRASRLNDDALFLLIAKAAPAYGPRWKKEHVTATQVRVVFAGIEALEKTWLKPKKVGQ